MTKHVLQMITTYTTIFEIEAPSREEAEEKLWDMYSNEEVDNLDTNNIDVNVYWAGYVGEDRQ